MPTGETQQWASLVEQLIAQGLVGGVLCMSAFIIGLAREWVVMGAHYRSVVKDRDEYKALLRTAEDTAAETREILAELTQKLERRI
jgi:hypothetical protein